MPLLLLLVGPTLVAAQAGPSRAALVVRNPDGKVQTACVSFAEQTITGEQLLERSGFKVIINPSGAMGGAVCSINDQGCKYPAEDCFCRCMGTQCEYWAYYTWAAESGAWQYSQTGANGVQVKDGDLQGWSWGPGNFSSGTEPPRLAFAGICKAGAVAAGQGRAAAGSTGAITQYAVYGLFAVLLLGLGALVLARRRA